MGIRIVLSRKRKKLNKNYDVVVLDKNNKRIKKIGFLLDDNKRNYKLFKINKKELSFWLYNGAALSDKLIKLCIGLIYDKEKN